MNRFIDISSVTLRLFHSTNLSSVVRLLVALVAAAISSSFWAEGHAQETESRDVKLGSTAKQHSVAVGNSSHQRTDASQLAGTVGVGTWNTKAAFRNIRLERANQTFQPSESNDSWFFESGDWKVVGEGLRCDQSASPALARVGKPAEHFTITLRARKLAGKEGFLIAFGNCPGGGRSWWNIGGFGNTKHALQIPFLEKTETPGNILPQRWYDIRVEIAARNVQCFLDGAKVLEASTTAIMDPTEHFGLGSWETQVEYEKIEILADGQLYFSSEFPADQNRWIRTSQTSTAESKELSSPSRKRAKRELDRDNSLKLNDYGQPTMAILGRNETLTLQAKKIDGQEGFLVLLGTGLNGNKAWWNIGGFGNSRHALELPGVRTLDSPGQIEQGKWYDIRVERSGIDIRCYLSNELIHDTSCIVNQTERQIRFEQMMSCEGASLLLPSEMEQFVALKKRSVYIGNSAIQTFQSVPSYATFAKLPQTKQRDLMRSVNRHRLTWDIGWGFEPILDRRQESILESIDEAVSLYNSIGVFDKHVMANNSPGTPTADANFDGSIRFGKSFNSRVALHELGHCMGVGTHPRWSHILVDGRWTGPIANELVKQFDGPEAMLKGDRMHMWPYGLNFDNEDGGDARRRHVLMVAAVRRDMGFHSAQLIHYTTDIPEGKYWLAARSAQSRLLTADRTGTTKEENVVIRDGNRSKMQEFSVQNRDDGTYSIKTAGTKSEGLGVNNNSNSGKLSIALAPLIRQSNTGWYIIPLGDGYFKISPQSNIELAMSVSEGTNEGEAPVQIAPFEDSFNQHWQLLPTTIP